MFKIFLALHLLTAIFAIGPLLHAATTSARGLKTGDSAATRVASRTVSIYSYASVLVIIFGFGLMSMEAPWSQSGESVAEMSETWIWSSAVLWLIAMAIALAVIVPTLNKATDAIKRSESVSALVPKVAASGGIVALIFVAIVILMVYQPA